jgi:hypothetical protein
LPKAEPPVCVLGLGTDGAGVGCFDVRATTTHPGKGPPVCGIRESKICEKRENFMENKYLEQARTTLGAELAVLEKKCYDRGYNDAQLGRPRSSPPTTSATASNAGATPDVVELARRAASYQEEQSKLGNKVTNADAVRFVYEVAGVPLQ